MNHEHQLERESLDLDMDMVDEMSEAETREQKLLVR